MSNPNMIFISKGEGVVAAVTENNDINKIMTYVNDQKVSYCSAEYAAYAYYSKDSVEMFPIWEACCDNVNKSFFSFINEQLKNTEWRTFSFPLPIINSSKKVLKAINKSSAYFVESRSDTLQLSTISLSYVLEGDGVDRDSIWTSIQNELGVSNLIHASDISEEGYLFSIKLYFNDLENLVKTKKKIDGCDKLQVQDIKIPTINVYNVFVRNDEVEKMKKQFENDGIVPYKISR